MRVFPVDRQASDKRGEVSGSKHSKESVHCTPNTLHESDTPLCSTTELLRGRSLPLRRVWREQRHRCVSFVALFVSRTAPHRALWRILLPFVFFVQFSVFRSDRKLIGCPLAIRGAFVECKTLTLPNNGLRTSALA